MKTLLKITLLSLICPTLAGLQAAATKPKLDRPTIVHAVTTAAETDLKHYHTLGTDDERVSWLNHFFIQHKPQLLQNELEQLTEILYREIYCAHKYEALAKLVISPAWRKHLMEFNKNLSVVFDFIDSSQPSKKKKPTRKGGNPYVCATTDLHRALLPNPSSQGQNEALETVQRLIASGIDIERDREDGVTALHLAICHHPKCVAPLLSVGANPGYMVLDDADLHGFIKKQTQPHGYTPLQLAANAYNFATIAMLIEAGAEEDKGIPGEWLSDKDVYPVLNCNTIITTGLNRKEARAQNWAYQLAFLQQLLGKTGWLPKALAPIIRDLVGLDYTPENHKPLTHLGGPASAPCTMKIEEIA